MKESLKKFNFALRDGFCVYQIECLKNKKKYVGCTGRNPSSRFQRHLIELKAGRHTNVGLQKDFDLYGEDNFEFSVLDMTDDRHMERQWMLRLRTNDDRYGYNGNDPCFGKKKVSSW